MTCCPECRCAVWADRMADKIDQMPAHGNSKMVTGAQYVLASFRQFMRPLPADFGVSQWKVSEEKEGVE